MSRVIVVVDGGVVTGVFSDDPETTVDVLDADDRRRVDENDEEAKTHFDNLSLEIEHLNDVL